MKEGNLYTVSLGCPKNLIDTEVMLGYLKRAGYRLVNREKDSDIIIVNTCSFINKAKEESIDTIMEMVGIKNKKRKKLLIVTGCLPQRYGNDLEALLPEVDAFVGTGECLRITKILKDLKNGKGKNYIAEPQYNLSHNLPRYRLTPKHTAYVKIADGCSRKCTFCAIPAIKGKFRSRNLDSIILEVKRLSKEGVKEINLIAQDLTAYGRDLYPKKQNLELLLKEMVKIKDVKWIRLLYCYPKGFTNSLIELIAREEKILNYIDIPLQHINNSILKEMGRGVDERSIKNLIMKIRKMIPDVTLRTSFIVGFPGETDRQFNELLSFVKGFRFDRLGVFEFSREEGTSAYSMKGQVKEEVKKRRYREIMKLQSKISLEKNLELIGKTVDAIVEKRNGNGITIARLWSQAPDVDGVTYIKGNNDIKVGELVKVRIKEVSNYDLWGQALIF